jgi:hypothetical protein
MIHREVSLVTDLSRLSVYYGNLLIRKSSGHGVPTQRHDNPWLDDVNLSVQVVVAGSHFNRLRIAVTRGAALDDVRDEHAPAVNPNLVEELAQKTPGSPDKWKALLVFMETGGFADEHDQRIHRTGTGHRLCTPYVQRAPSTLMYLSVNIL